MTSASADETRLLQTPKKDPDTELHWRQDGGHRIAILKQRKRGKYFRFPEARAIIWTLCDGHRTVLDIADRVAQLGGPRDQSIVHHVIERMAADGLLQGIAVDRAPRAVGRCAQGGLAARCRRVLTVRVAIRDVDWLANFLYRHVGCRLLRGLMKVLMAGVICGGFLVFAWIWLFDPGVSAPFGQWLWLLPLLMLGCTLLHETAHALTVKHFGRDVIGVGLGWFWLGPIFFVDTSDMWLANRRERILTSLAGPLSDLLVASLLTIASLLLPPSLSSLAFLASALRYLTVVFCLSPFLEYDGYYALCDYLQRPNLRRDSFVWLSANFRQPSRIWTGITRRRTECLYSLASVVYLVLLVIMNGHANYLFFAGLLKSRDLAWLAGPAVWVITLGLFAVFVSGLVTDIQGLLVAKSRQPNILLEPSHANTSF